MTDRTPDSTPDPIATPEVDAPAPARARQGPLAIWIRRLPRAVYVGIVLAVLVALVLIAVVLNPGERVGPVHPANPPVGGPDLPAARLAMLLAIDIGNTQTVIGLFGDDDADDAAVGLADRTVEAGLLDHWRISTNAERTSDEHALVIQEFLGFHGFSFDDDIDGIAISSVVPRTTAAFREMTEKYFGFHPVVIEPGVKTGLPILTENPREVGADRIANAVAALDLYGGPAVIIDFGTATTYDALSAKGEYLGGAIAPGIEISLDALYTRAAALRRVELVEPRNVIGRTTVESIQAGAVFGFAGQVDGICRRIADELGDPVVVATGGLAELIAPYTSSIKHVEPWLTLHGLRVVFDRNQ